MTRCCGVVLWCGGGSGAGGAGVVVWGCGVVVLHTIASPHHGTIAPTQHRSTTTHHKTPHLRTTAPHHHITPCPITLPHHRAKAPPEATTSRHPTAAPYNQRRLSSASHGLCVYLNLCVLNYVCIYVYRCMLIYSNKCAIHVYVVH